MSSGDGGPASAQPRRASLLSGRSCRVLLASRELQSLVSKRCSVTRVSLCRESRARQLVEWWTILVTGPSPDMPPAIPQARKFWKASAQRGCEEASQLREAGCPWKRMISCPVSSGVTKKFSRTPNMLKACSPDVVFALLSLIGITERLLRPKCPPRFLCRLQANERCQYVRRLSTLIRKIEAERESDFALLPSLDISPIRDLERFISAFETSHECRR